MVVFIDTSSLAKRYIEESGSTEVDLFFVPGNIIYLAPTTPIEIRSVLSRRLREKSLEEATVQLALGEWMKEEPLYHIMQFTEQLRNGAIEVIERTGIRTLDAIQLSSARYSNASIFVTSDKALAAAADLIFAGQTTFI